MKEITITDELLDDEIHQMAFEEGQPADNGDGYLFTAEEFDLFVDRLLTRDRAALVEHIRSLTERLEKAEKDAELFRHLMFNHVERAGNGAVLLKFGPYPEQQLRKTLSAAIAQEGADHE